MKRSLSLLFLYRTKLGRIILKLLVNPKVSVLGGHFLSSKLSKPLIPYYIKKYNIDMSACKRNRFFSFNDFFKREKTFDICKDENALISPCDGYLSVYHISKSSCFTVKNNEYTMLSLFRDYTLAEEFDDGYALIFRLEPIHYHRYIYPVDAVIKKRKRIDGVLHTVRPDYYGNIPVFIENSRDYTVMNSPAIGKFLQMEVGALMVGKISNHLHKGRVKKGSEKGYFEFGGSTIILLLKKDSVKLEDKYYSRINSDTEIPVKIGEKIAVI